MCYHSDNVVGRILCKRMLYKNQSSTFSNDWQSDRKITDTDNCKTDEDRP